MTQFTQNAFAVPPGMFEPRGVQGPQGSLGNLYLDEGRLERVDLDFMAWGT